MRSLKPFLIFFAVTTALAAPLAQLYQEGIAKEKQLQQEQEQRQQQVNKEIVGDRGDVVKQGIDAAKDTLVLDAVVAMWTQRDKKRCLDILAQFYQHEARPDDFPDNSLEDCKTREKAQAAEKRLGILVGAATPVIRIPSTRTRNPDDNNNRFAVGPADNPAEQATGEQPPTDQTSNTAALEVGGTAALGVLSSPFWDKAAEFIGGGSDVSAYNPS